MDDPAFEIYRDPHGVPHVRASDELALAHGQGYVTALDRGWQIEVDRWRAEGRLAERLGPAGLEWDLFAHRVRLADTARRAYAALADEDRAWVDAYTAGVHAGLGRPGVRGSGRDVPEMAALADPAGPLGGDLPPHEPWPAWAPLGVFLVAHVLFSGFAHVLWREHVARTLGPAHPQVPVGELVDLFAAEAGPSSGSNAWALHGSRTASGLPLLAGDPHRLLELPGVYQQVRLACDDYDVVGLAFPGVPGLPHFGHAGRAAWGITNAMAHHVEVFAERLSSTGGTISAQGPDGPEPVDTRTATVLVRGPGGPAAHRVETYETARGVVVTGGPGDEQTYAVRLPARVDADLGVGAWRRLLHARTADDVMAAFDGWVDPVNRVLAADGDGQVLRGTAGRVAHRAPHERVRPVPAWTDAARPVPWRDLPAPAAVPDVAVDANERPDPTARPGHGLGHRYAPPHRARRIRALLDDAGDAQAAADQSRVHGDTLLGSADALLAWLPGGARAGAPSPDEDRPDAARADERHEPGAPDLAAERLAARLRAWDRRMDADSHDAALYASWRSALARRLVAHPALAALHAPHGLAPVLDPWFSVPARVGDVLANLLGASSVGIDGRSEAYAALADVAAGRTGDDPEATWGETHRVLGLHVLLDVPGAAASTPDVAPLPLGGDTDCVRCTASAPGVGDTCVRGSVARWVWDLADRGASRWGVPFGASGDPGSPHFADQHPDWAAARTVPVVTDWSALTREEHP